eukprot:11485752-Alexandrium_andersonii.AAC.1
MLRARAPAPASSRTVADLERWARTQLRASDWPQLPRVCRSRVPACAMARGGGDRASVLREALSGPPPRLEEVGA